MRSRYNPPRSPLHYFKGYRPIIYARDGLMLGIRQPLDGPVFRTPQDAEHWRIHAMFGHFDRGLGMSDATIEPFEGLGCLIHGNRENGRIHKYRTGRGRRRQV